jgi:hypothetical protein
MHALRKKLSRGPRSPQNGVSPAHLDINGDIPRSDSESSLEMPSPTDSAPGQRDLKTLLSTLTTRLHHATYVFVTIPYSQPAPAAILTSSSTIMTFREKEGLTIITTKEVAEEHELKYVFRSKLITSEVQSSLEAVGFMAVITKALAGRGIGCNPVSAYFHDHLLVPEDKAEEAVDVLRDLAGKGV